MCVRRGGAAVPRVDFPASFGFIDHLCGSCMFAKCEGLATMYLKSSKILKQLGAEVPRAIESVELTFSFAHAIVMMK